MTPPLTELAERLGLEGPCAHLEEALTHPSYANEHKGSARDNQRLEFLGDAVLGLCVSEQLMDRFRDAREGELSLMRASLVNTEALASWARDANVGTALRLGRGADAAGERTQKNVLADAVEAIVGAVYLDLGLSAARRVSRAIVAEPLERLATGPRLERDAKSELQERVQARGGASPKYRVVEAIGPDHNREFVVAVDVDGEVLGEGRGRSKKQAEQDAARAALHSGHPLTLAAGRTSDPGPQRISDPGAQRISDPGPQRISDPGAQRISDPGPQRMSDPGDSPESHVERHSSMRPASEPPPAEQRRAH
ncbi:MAG: ribonuclease III [Polyangiaceae bacterium]